MRILGENKKISFEGEGIRIGLKTLLFQYPGKLEIVPDLYRGVWSMYVTTEKLDNKLFKFLEYWAKEGKRITIETKRKIPDRFYNLKNILFFRVTDKFVPSLILKKKELLKIRILKAKDLDRLILVANKYAFKKENHNRILLMPEFKSKNLGKVMISKLNDIHPMIRFMPPVQDILYMP